MAVAQRSPLSDPWENWAICFRHVQGVFSAENVASARLAHWQSVLSSLPSAARWLTTVYSWPITARFGCTVRSLRTLLFAVLVGIVLTVIGLVYLLRGRNAACARRIDHTGRAGRAGGKHTAHCLADRGGRVAQLVVRDLGAPRFGPRQRSPVPLPRAMANKVKCRTCSRMSISRLARRFIGSPGHRRQSRCPTMASHAPSV